MGKMRIATVWLDGCSGCHMSFLDMDERLLAIAAKIDLVYSPLVDAKVFPQGVDLAIVEGAVSNEDDLHKIGIVRQRSTLLMALGDCAVTSNVPGMRNAFCRDELLRCAYVDRATINPGVPGTPGHPGHPGAAIPRLLPRARPIHELVHVDIFIPGCPPPADAIFDAIAALLSGAPSDAAQTLRFG